MLQHMIKTQILDLVLAGVNLVVRVFKIRLDDKGRRIPSFRRGSMVGAGISAFGQHIRNGAVLVGVSNDTCVF